MKLFLLRHADALNVGNEGIRRDEDRPLSPAGWRQARRAAAAIRNLKIELDGILSSPLLRARQTAEAVADSIPGGLPVEAAAELAGGSDPEPVVAALAERPAGERILLVGHLPQLGLLLSLLVWGREAPEVPLRKAGLACLTVSRLRPSPSARLEWILTPDHYPGLD